ncbi:ABC transporter substrate-binding protein [Streptomyces aidingensis]|uniref:Peptide/nickel transport system substrate-binding protein n=1 Tax=Streptomyces aidingensis TaxID=910347 RepID=A0A1I1SRH6_9ACTN|nr:ABC transporter substrate-binding protein [Streptomyces aidingensis]SFD49065.1 peptide/nickel transport system substrate-binding protein [Streptomyces aidingensis]
MHAVRSALRSRTRSAAVLIAAVTALGLAASACATSERDDDSADDGEAFVFAAAGDPASLDPALASDGETFRITRQVLETLIDHESGGTEMVGGLAETWESNPEGTEWTFHLREGVTFHDGEALTGEVVCQNFDRWFNFTGTYQATALTYYWQAEFGGFAENQNEEAPEPNYAGCEAPDDLTAVIKVARPSAVYPGAFSLAAFAIHSPKSLDAYAEDEASGEGENINYPAYSQGEGHDGEIVIAGTGPFRYESWDKSNGEVTISRFDDYWGEPAGFDEIVFRTISDEGARRQALEAGEIHGYDLVAPGDVDALTEAGFQVPTRGVFNLFYLGITQESDPALEDLRVRRAIAHALDRQTLVDTQLPEGGVVATQFIPDTVDGYAEDVTTYEYDTAKAQDLLAEAGAGDLSLEFCYPTEVTRPYMPAPADMYELLKADLEAAGITVSPKPMKWSPDYLDTTRAGGCNLYLLGWTGDFNDAYNFLGTWFDGYSKEWGFENQELFDAMAAAAVEPDVATRVEMYRELNRMIMDFLPGVPISSSPPSIAFSPDVNPPTVSPLTQEKFAEGSFA